MHQGGVGGVNKVASVACPQRQRLGQHVVIGDGKIGTVIWPLEVTIAIDMQPPLCGVQHSIAKENVSTAYSSSREVSTGDWPPAGA